MFIHSMFQLVQWMFMSWENKEGLPKEGVI